MKTIIWLFAIAGSTMLTRADDAPAKSPADALPPHITRLTHFGERADFSHDGKRILFVEKTYGDVYEVDIATRAIRPVTHHYPHNGYTRALYLANGDILLSGCRTFDPQNPHFSRDHAELFVLDKRLKTPPTPLGEMCSEGPCVSRTKLHIAWTLTRSQAPDRLQPGQSQIWTGDIEYTDGVPKLVHRTLALDSATLPFKCTLECQNFRPPAETEITFSAYGHQGTDVCGVDLATRKVTNYSNAPDQYDEPEGIYPDGQYTLVECDKHRQGQPGPRGPGHVDLYKLKLDGTGTTERLTTFNDYPGYKASNPVVSDDAKFIAFQLARTTDPAGVGYGIFLYDIDKAKK